MIPLPDSELAFFARVGWLQVECDLDQEPDSALLSDYDFGGNTITVQLVTNTYAPPTVANTPLPTYASWASSYASWTSSWGTPTPTPLGSSWSVDWSSPGWFTFSGSDPEPELDDTDDDDVE